LVQLLPTRKARRGKSRHSNRRDRLSKSRLLSLRFGIRGQDDGAPGAVASQKSVRARYGVSAMKTPPVHAIDSTSRPHAPRLVAAVPVASLSRERERRALIARCTSRVGTVREIAGGLLLEARRAELKERPLTERSARGCPDAALLGKAVNFLPICETVRQMLPMEAAPAASVHGRIRECGREGIAGEFGSVTVDERITSNARKTEVGAFHF
jgi:hypothetical protein